MSMPGWAGAHRQQGCPIPAPGPCPSSHTGVRDTCTLLLRERDVSSSQSGVPMEIPAHLTPLPMSSPSLPRLCLPSWIRGSIQVLQVSRACPRELISPPGTVPQCCPSPWHCPGVPRLLSGRGAVRDREGPSGEGPSGEGP